MVFSMQRGRQTVFSPTVEVWDSSAVHSLNFFISLRLKQWTQIFQSHSLKLRGWKKCLIIYDQRLVFSGGDMERLPEFALGVGGGSFSVNRETFRNRQGFVVLPTIRLISFEDSLRWWAEIHGIAMRNGNEVFIYTSISFTSIHLVVLIGFVSFLSFV